MLQHFEVNSAEFLYPDFDVRPKRQSISTTSRAKYSIFKVSFSSYLTLLRETEGSLNIDKKVSPHRQQRNAVNMISKIY